MSSFVIIRLDTLGPTVRAILPTWTVPPAEIQVRLTADEPMDVGRQEAVFTDAGGHGWPFVLADDGGDLVANVPTVGWAPGPATMDAQVWDMVGNSTRVRAVVDVRSEAELLLELRAAVAATLVGLQASTSQVTAQVSGTSLSAAVAGSLVMAEVASTGVGATVAPTTLGAEVKR